MPAPSPTAAPPVAIADEGECRRLIEAVTLIDDPTIRAADACRFTPIGAQAARDVMANASASPDQLWAALWVYAASGSDPAPLRPLASHADSTLRAMASATLVAFGDRAGFVPLAELLADQTSLSGARPPVTVSAFAANSLSRYVAAGGAPAADAADPAAQASAWQAWLSANAETLQYSVTEGVWTLP